MRNASDLLEDSYRRTDRTMLSLLWLLFAVGLCMAPQYGRWGAAIGVGLAGASGPVAVSRGRVAALALAGA